MTIAETYIGHPSNDNCSRHTTRLHETSSPTPSPVSNALATAALAALNVRGGATFYTVDTLFELSDPAPTPASNSHEHKLTKEHWLSFLREQYQQYATQGSSMKKEVRHSAERGLDYLIADYLDIDRRIVDLGRSQQITQEVDDDWLRIVSLRSHLRTEYLTNKIINAKAAKPTTTSPQRQARPSSSLPVAPDARSLAAGEGLRRL